MNDQPEGPQDGGNMSDDDDDDDDDDDGDEGERENTPSHLNLRLSIQSDQGKGGPARSQPSPVTSPKRPPSGRAATQPSCENGHFD